MLFREVVTLGIHYVVQPKLTSTSYMQLCTYIVPFYFALHHSIPYPSSVIRDTLEPEHLFIHFVVVFLPAVHVVMIIYCPVQLPIVGWDIMRGGMEHIT